MAFMDYSEKMKLIRKQLEISQTELANLLSVDYTTVSRIERKVFNPSCELIKKIDQLCQKKGVSFENGVSLVIQKADTNDVTKDVISIIDNSYATANKAVNYLLVQRNWLIWEKNQ